MGKRIKLIPARMETLWTAMAREDRRLQDAAAAVARIAASLEMEVAAKANIDASLATLQKQLKQQSANMQTMQQLAQMAASEMDAQDAALAGQAKGLVYDVRQTAVAGAMLSNLKWNGTRGGLDLSAMANVDMLSNMTALLGPQPGVPLDTLNGVSLTTLLTQELGATDTHMTDAFIASCMQNPIYQLAGLAGLGGVASTTREGMDAIIKPKSSGKSNKQSQPQPSPGFFQWGKDAVNKIGSKVSKGAEEIQKKANEAKKWAEKKLDQGFEAVKKVANNKYVKKYTEIYSQGLAYNWELTGDLFTIGGDIVGFASSCVSRNPLDIASDGYSLINDCFVFYQDGEALLQQAFGNIHTVLGNEDYAQEFYADAQASSEREGLADELYHVGFDEVGMVVEVVDGVNTGYQIFSGFESVLENAKKIGTALFDEKNFAAAKELILEQFGWKIPDSLDGSSALEDFIARKKDVVGNIGLGYKYIDGLLEGDFFETFLENTGLGKPVSKIADAGEAFEEFLDRVLGISEKNRKKKS